MRRSVAFVLGLGFVSGCGGTGPAMGAAVNAAINTAIAVGASAAQRASGGCYAICIDGTVCNPQNGLCERRPCTRGCGPTGTCDTNGMCQTVAPGGQVPLVPPMTFQPTPGSSPQYPAPIGPTAAPPPPVY